MLKIITTKDHSPTLYSEKFNASYHSLFGAFQESELVYIHNGFRFFMHKMPSSINIFEVGWGTGLNGLLTFIEHQKNFYDTMVHYYAVEKFPVDKNIIENLFEYYPFSENIKIFQKMHFSENKISLSKNFILEKIFDDIFEVICKIPDNTIDVVYYDAFAPSAQPEMWSEKIFMDVYNKMKTNAVLVSFCANGSFKRILKKTGFKVEALKGAAGKREMTRAIKI